MSAQANPKLTQAQTAVVKKPVSLVDKGWKICISYIQDDMFIVNCEA